MDTYMQAECFCLNDGRVCEYHKALAKVEELIAALEDQNRVTGLIPPVWKALQEAKGDPE